MNRTARIVLAASLAAARRHRMPPRRSYIWVNQDRYIPACPPSCGPTQATDLPPPPSSTRRPAPTATTTTARTARWSTRLAELGGHLRDVYAKGHDCPRAYRCVLDPPQSFDPRVAELQLAIRSSDDFALSTSDRAQ